MAAGGAALGLFFRDFLSSGLDLVFGDVGDARLNVYILEHWARVFAGKASWLSPEMFHPVQGALGYSDALFLHALPYAALRAGGLDPYLAFELSMALVKVLGFVGMALLLHEGMRLPHAAAALGAVLFTVANVSYAHLSHPQLLAVAFVPWIWWLLLEALRARRERRARALRCGLGAAVLTPLLLYTSYYVGWFAVFIGLLYTIVHLVLVYGRRAHRLAWEFAREERRLACAMAATSALCLVPFLWTYVPVQARFGGRSMRDVLPFIPQPMDLINVGPGNVLWGWISRWLEGIPDEAPWWGFRIGHPLVLWGLFAATLAVAWRKRGLVGETARRESGPGEREEGLHVAAVAVTVLVACAVSVQVMEESLWGVLRAVVPGAAALRAVGRIQAVLSIGVIAVAMAGMVDLGNRLRGSGYGRSTTPLAIGLLGVLLVAEHFNVGPHSRIRRSEDRAYLAAVPEAPAPCRVFYVEPPAPAGRPYYAVQLDAMLLAQREGVPTINGYSGQFPKGWDLLNVRAPEYRSAVASWVERHDLDEGLCALSLHEKRWWVRE